MPTHSSGELTTKRCLPCEGGIPRYTLAEAQEQLKAIPKWTLNDSGTCISRQWKLKNFLAGMQLLEKAAEIAEADQHHPDLHLTSYRLVRIDLTTHAIDGLSENDFIIAAKLDAAVEALGL